MLTPWRTRLRGWNQLWREPAFHLRSILRVSWLAALLPWLTRSLLLLLSNSWRMYRGRLSTLIARDTMRSLSSGDPLLMNPALLPLSSMYDQEEKLVASQIHKLLKSSNPSPSPRGPVLQFGQGSQQGPSFVGPMFSTGFRGRRGGRSGPSRGKCFYCKSAGHFIANCPLNKKKQ